MIQSNLPDDHAWIDDFADLVDATGMTLAKMAGAIIGLCFAIYLMIKHYK